MKSGCAVAIVFVLYIAASFLTQGYLDKSAAGVEQKAKEIEESILAEDWEKAADGISELSSQWETLKRRWLLLEDHDQIDDIDESLRMAQDMIKLREKPQSMDAMGRLIFYISDVPDKGRLEIANIF